MVETKDNRTFAQSLAHGAPVVASANQTLTSCGRKSAFKILSYGICGRMLIIYSPNAKEENDRFSPQEEVFMKEISLQLESEWKSLPKQKK